MKDKVSVCKKNDLRLKKIELSKLKGESMSPWPEKYVIGLTGNIATGKSVVRKMLEHMGAYGIDADALSHRVMAKGAPGFQPIVDYFGRWVLDSEGQIDRKRLGGIVFANPKALAKLESIIHPFVRQAISILAQRAKQKVIVIEAIKLVEGPLKESCDSIWVTDAAPKVQLARLLKKRKMSEQEAKQRILSQNPQKEKLAHADVIINNAGSFEDTWRQVAAAWAKAFPKTDTGPVELAKTQDGELSVQRATPRLAGAIAEFITKHSDGQKEMTRTDVMEAFGEKAFMVVMSGEELRGVVGWQVENLVSRVIDFYFAPSLSLKTAVPDLMKEVETASRELQSEAALLFLPAKLAKSDVWKQMKYEKRAIEDMTVRAWQEAARESDIPGTEMLFKQLRIDRVLRPI
jgi:dephospho-CoA kinase